MVSIKKIGCLVQEGLSEYLVRPLQEHEVRLDRASSSSALTFLSPDHIADGNYENSFAFFTRYDGVVLPSSLLHPFPSKRKR